MTFSLYEGAHADPQELKGKLQEKWQSSIYTVAPPPDSVRGPELLEPEGDTEGFSLSFWVRPLNALASS